MSLLTRARSNAVVDREPVGPVAAPAVGVGQSNAQLLDLMQGGEAGAARAAGPDTRPYSHLDVTTALMKTDINGNFVDQSKEEYDATKLKLESDAEGRPVRDQDVRFEMLRSRIEAADAARAASQADLSETDDAARVMGMFVAPEWVLGKNNTKEDMDEYVGRFSALSANHPDMLMVPGTSVWQERRDKGRFTKENVLHSSADAYFGGEHVHRTNKMNIGFDENGVEHQFKDEAQSDQRAKKWWNKADEHQAGAASSGLFQAGGRNFALDICADHGDGSVAAKEYMANGGGRGVDAHILTSHSAQLKENSTVVKDGGHFVHSDSQLGWGSLGSANDTSKWKLKEQDGKLVSTSAEALGPDFQGYHRSKIETMTPRKIGADVEHQGTRAFA